MRARADLGAGDAAAADGLAPAPRSAPRRLGSDAARPSRSPRGAGAGTFSHDGLDEKLTGVGAPARVVTELLT